MTLREAHSAWSKQGKIMAFAAKTRWIFERLFKTLYEKPCEQLTASVLSEAIRKATAAREDKVKGASVVVHVLTFAGVKPAFSYSDLTEQAEVIQTKSSRKRGGTPPRSAGHSGQERTESAKDIEHEFPEIERKLQKKSQKLPEIEQKLPDMKQKKEVVTASPQTQEGDTDRLGRSRNRAPRAVAQIDASTLTVIKVWPKMTAAEKILGVWGIDRAIKKCRPAGGFYWCNADEVDSFVPAEDMRGRGARGSKTEPTGKPAGTVAKPKAKTAAGPCGKPQGTVATKKKTAKTAGTVRMTVKDAAVLPAPATDEKPEGVTPLAETAGTVETKKDDAPIIDEKIGGVGHGKPKPGKQSPTVAMPTGNARGEEPSPTLFQFTDKELIDEIQRRGWEGDVLLKIKNVTIKIEL